MPKYLAVYIGVLTPEEKKQMKVSDQIQQKGMQEWGEWTTKHSASIVSQGGPLGRTKRVSASGIEDHRNTLVGYVIVEANSLDAAAKIFTNHPHFSVFPGDSVEVMECLDIPGM